MQLAKQKLLTVFHTYLDTCRLTRIHPYSSDYLLDPRTSASPIQQLILAFNLARSMVFWWMIMAAPMLGAGEQGSTGK